MAVTPLDGRCAAAANLVMWPATHAALPKAVGVLRASASSPPYALVTARPASVAGQEMTALGVALSAAAGSKGSKGRSDAKLQREQTVKIAADVCAALLYLHSNYVCHGEVGGSRSTETPGRDAALNAFEIRLGGCSLRPHSNPIRSCLYR